MSGDDELARYWSQCCDGKARYSARLARTRVSEQRAGDGAHVEAYRCPFSIQHPDHPFHIGAPMSLGQIAHVAMLLRARSGNAPTPPGHGTTRRQRRAAARATRGHESGP